MEKISAVYIASPFETRYGYVERALQAGKHVLCEKPMVFNVREAKHLFKLAQDHGVILMEAIKTEYCPGFRRLISCAKSGKIGRIICVDATFTKLALSRMRKIQNCKFCGSVIELAAYPLLAILQLLGYNYESIQFDSWYEHNKQVDLFTQIHLQYPEAVATAKVGLGVKSEDSLVISGTRGCIYVPAPWWKTEYFELCFEDPNDVEKNFYKFSGDGVRYELSEFLTKISEGHMNEAACRSSVEITNIIEKYQTGDVRGWICGSDGKNHIIGC